MPITRAITQTSKYQSLYYYDYSLGYSEEARYTKREKNLCVHYN